MIDTKFLNHPLIREIKDEKHWTIPTNDKKPLDVRLLKEKDIIDLATDKNSKCLMSLDELLSFIKEKEPNVTEISMLQYAMHAHLNSIVCIDIEKTAVPKTFELFHNTNWIYAEKSASGKGAHYFYKVSDDLLNQSPFKEYYSKKKTDLQFEILIGQYVIFTGNQITKPREEIVDVEPILREMFPPDKGITLSLEAIKLNDIKVKDIAEFDMIKNNIMQVTYRKTKEDFHGDTSSFEFGYMATIHNKLKIITHYIEKYRGIKYSLKDMQNMMLYFALKKLPYREKHNRPDYLPRLINSVISKNSK